MGSTPFAPPVGIIPPLVRDSVVLVDAPPAEGVDAAGDDEGKAAMIDVPSAPRNVVQQLQAEPQCYRLFGVWWWPMKAILKRAGYGPAQLYMLSSYQDRETASQVPRASLDDTLREAFEEYPQNAAYRHRAGRAEAPDGELVTIWDQDAAL